MKRLLLLSTIIASPAFATMETTLIGDCVYIPVENTGGTVWNSLDPLCPSVALGREYVVTLPDHIGEDPEDDGDDTPVGDDDQSDDDDDDQSDDDTGDDDDDDDGDDDDDDSEGDED